MDYFMQFSKHYFHFIFQNVKDFYHVGEFWTFKIELIYPVVDPKSFDLDLND